MYSAPGAATASSSASKSSIAIIGSVLCGGLLLFLLAATIVLALIPLYVPKKSATLDPNSGITNDFATEIALPDAARKRATSNGDVSQAKNYPGATVDTNTKANVKNIFSGIATKHKCFSTVVIVTITVQVTSRKRRFSLAKRQSSTTFLNVVSYAVVVASRCSGSSVITAACTSLSNLLFNNIASGGFVLSNVILMDSNGNSLLVITTVRLVRCLGYPSIRPGKVNSVTTTRGTKAPTGFPTGNVG